MTAVEQIAETVLYEGYLLWPYRRSATKNQQRWTFGGVYPRRYSEARGDDNVPWWMQTECLLQTTNGRDVDPLVTVRIRFLQVVRRDVLRCQPDGSRVAVDELRVGPDRYLSWDEASERTVVCEDLLLSTLLQVPIPRSDDFSRSSRPIHVSAGRHEEPLYGAHGDLQGWLVRSWKELQGSLHVYARPVRHNVFRLTVRVANETPWQGQMRDDTVGALREPPHRQTFNSTHTILHVKDAHFLSLMDPPPDLAAEARACQNVKTWPVLVGEGPPQATARTMLSSPIILYDYPQVAPESPCNLFDSTEIDELLILNLLTLTDEEKAEIRATDSRACVLLERSESLTGDDFMRLHGAIREFRTLSRGGVNDPFPTLMDELEQPPPGQIMVGDVPISRGSRVRLHPRAGGDIMDLALAEKIAIVEAIEQDYEGHVHLAVVLEEDPGRDLGLNRQPGHRFFFSPEEIEPLSDP